MNDRKPVWTESLDQGRAYLDDGMIGLGSDGQSETVDDRVTNKGVLYLMDCQRCGRQIKSTFPWSEVVLLYTRQPVVPNVKFTQQGVLFLMPCRCGKQNPVIFAWTDISRYVQHAVQAQILSPKILQAR